MAAERSSTPSCHQVGDVVAHRLVGQVEFAGDPTLLQSACDQVENLEFPAGELGKASRPPPAASPVKNRPAGQPPRGEDRATRGDRPDRVQQLVTSGALDDVASRAGAHSRDTASSSALIVIIRTRMSVRSARIRTWRRLLKVGQVQVHEHDVGGKLGRQRDAASATSRASPTISRSPAPVSAARTPSRNKRMVVHQQDPGHRASVGSPAWTSVPVAALVTLI